MRPRSRLEVGSLYALRGGTRPRWRVAAVLHRASSYNEVLLEHLDDPTLTSQARVYAPGFDPRDLTLPALVRVLDGAYRAEHGKGGVPLTPEQQVTLADYLACHDLVREMAWEQWRQELGVREQDQARHWLDLTLMDSAPEDMPIT
ncbi:MULTISPECIES: hypothetical protein [Deinococcus]|uniref:hypothetical protein n=1 Tax=Deinococcus TaxID=1298 RepID=UPI0004D55B41|nr:MULTISPECIES: hypothetical protein [Deinococcus]KEF35776.1 hypothetical protein RDMS_00045 [Deinococcus sp. RL]